jgi:hypothetical protein
MLARMKTVFSCLVALANVIATSASDELASQGLTPNVERHAANRNKPLASEGKSASSGNRVFA